MRNGHCRVLNVVVLPRKKLLFLRACQTLELSCMDLGTYLIAFCEFDRATHGGMSFQGLYSILEIGARFDKVKECGSDLLDIFT